MSPPSQRGPPVRPFRIGGPLCDGGDIYTGDPGSAFRYLPSSTEAGAVIAFFDVGAYSLECMSAYNGRDQPAAYMIDEDGIREIAVPRTVADLVATSTSASSRAPAVVAAAPRPKILRRHESHTRSRLLAGLRRRRAQRPQPRPHQGLRARHRPRPGGTHLLPRHRPLRLSAARRRARPRAPPPAHQEGHRRHPGSREARDAAGAHRSQGRRGLSRVRERQVARSPPGAGGVAAPATRPGRPPDREERHAEEERPRRVAGAATPPAPGGDPCYLSFSNAGQPAAALTSVSTSSVSSFATPGMAAMSVLMSRRRCSRSCTATCSR